MTPELLNLLTPEERAAWALCEGATDDGPWRVIRVDAAHDDCEIRSHVGLVVRSVFGPNARHIADARTSLPLALTTIATLRANIKAGRAAIRDEVAAMRVTLGEVQVLAVDLGRDNEILRDHLRKQQEAFIIGLELAQRTSDAEIAELRATLDNERAKGSGPSDGWTWDEGCSAWCLGSPVIATVERWTAFVGGHVYWTVATNTNIERKHQYSTARDAMKAADAAVKGAT